MAASSQLASKTASPTAGEKLPATVIQVRGVPLRVADQALHAVRFGYCPVSSTGYRSHYCQPLPSPTALEEIAKEADKQRASALRRLREAKAGSPKGRTPDQRFSDFIMLEGAISAAVNQAYLAPPSDQDKLLREIATTTEALALFIVMGHAKPLDPGSHWTPEFLVERAQAYHRLCALTCRLLARLCQRGRAIDIAAWGAFVDALPRGPGFSMLPPTVLLKLLGRDGSEKAGTSSDAVEVCGASAPQAVEDIDEQHCEPDSRVAPAELVAANAAPVWTVDKRGQLSMF
ncbi:hypothetical protein HUE56_29940 (plasmid) [Azospirillum oryzae]|uniref:Uncharacterized protein n=1 Tax=Azospirillum oryzae TaxID=286727 RepID=A0A6N1ASZ4_9PROT|nr:MULTISPECIES: hypothetical protein [Azospirillum]KAA0584701.1 hypothetical protein FZ938_28325 [Azospirillum oryzae]QCG99269.1 hypothetical protein E6C67_36385 [Azospirillum sp. TSA2s]QKS54726.1 hypothetical protein HUE56_29940 [Azospirillum oryzae]GLR77620.1 hypothetical protein GCM10007856_02880 [Azospirillum oryzae]